MGRDVQLRVLDQSRSKMKFSMLFGVLFSLLMSMQSAQAQDLELKSYPPLKPLHFCQDSTGEVKEQIDECEFGKTEVSSITTARDPAPVGETPAAGNPDAKATTPAVSVPNTAASTPNTVPQSTGSNSPQLLLSFLAFSLIVSVICAKRGRSGILTFLVSVLGGALLDSVIVAAGTGVGGTAATVGLFAVPAVMLLRALLSN